MVVPCVAIGGITVANARGAGGSGRGFPRRLGRGVGASGRAEAAVRAFNALFA